MDLGDTIIVVSQLSLGVVTVIGNVLVILAVITSRRLQNPANFLIINLAVSDFFQGAASMPLRVAELLNGSGESLVRCDIVIGTTILFKSASNFNLALIALDRFCAIARPFAYANHTKVSSYKIVVALSWLLSLSLAAAPALGWRRKTPENAGKICRYGTTLTDEYVILYVTLVDFLPLLIMFVTYTYILRVTRRQISIIRAQEVAVRHAAVNLACESRRESELNVWYPLRTIANHETPPSVASDVAAKYMMKDETTVEAKLRSVNVDILEDAPMVVGPENLSPIFTDTAVRMNGHCVDRKSTHEYGLKDIDTSQENDNDSDGTKTGDDSNDDVTACDDTKTGNESNDDVTTCDDTKTGNDSSADVTACDDTKTGDERDKILPSSGDEIKSCENSDIARDAISENSDIARDASSENSDIARDAISENSDIARDASSKNSDIARDASSDSESTCIETSQESSRMHLDIDEKVRNCLATEKEAIDVFNFQIATGSDCSLPQSEVRESIILRSPPTSEVSGTMTYRSSTAITHCESQHSAFVMNAMTGLENGSSDIVEKQAEIRHLGEIHSDVEDQRKRSLHNNVDLPVSTTCNRKATRTVMAIIGFYVVLCLPITIIDVVELWCGVCEQTPRAVFIIALCMVSSNASVNVFVYGGYNTDYRKAYLNVWYRLKNACSVLLSRNKNNVQSSQTHN